MRKLISTVALCAVLAACAQPGQQGYGEPGTVGMNKTTGGALVGAGVGGLVGSQFGHGEGKGVATVLGVIAGGILGSQVGASLDRADQMALHNTTVSNPNSGNYGTVTPGPVQQVAGGQYCREFQQTIVVGGQQQQAYGRACRQPDGTWKIVQ
jgi:surface antigen